MLANHPKDSAVHRAAIVGRLFQVQSFENELILEDKSHTAIVFEPVSGKILDVVAKDTLNLDAADIYDYGDKLLVPGFIDCHTHYPQVDMIGAYSGELLDWLREHTFVQEERFINQEDEARLAAKRFIGELFRNGTTSSVVFGSTCGLSTNILFEEMDQAGGRMITGKVSMDRNAPDHLLSDWRDDIDAQRQLINKWHKKSDRLRYALSPRFAPTSTPEALQALGDLAKSDSDLYVQTHYAENHDEIAWVKQLFPDCRDYLDVYETNSLLRKKTILAHGIHTSSDEKKRMLDAGCLLSHCPTSNLFLGSGLFEGREHILQGHNIGLGTDVGAGTSFSLWQTMAEAIKISKLRGQQITPEEAFYWATVGGAKGLGWDHDVGVLTPGKKLDLQVIDLEAKPDLQARISQCESSQQVLSALIFSADDRNLHRLWVDGKDVFPQVNS
ncbi:MAG: guanine deaminase [Pseudobacteriovorax sp.]|nr:guanine deaminase [Pseudobacteriovorax sp.]